MTGAFLSCKDILVVTAGYWDTAKRIRHKMPLQWAARGARVLWLEQSPFPGPEWRAPGVLRRSLLSDIREVAPRLFVVTMPPALPLMYKGGFGPETLKSLQRPFYVRRLKRYLKALRFDPAMVVLFQQAARRDIFDLFKDKICIYYNHDVYGYGYATPGQERALEACCKKANMVWCVAKEHQEALKKYNSNTHFLPHAVDENWFHTLRTRSPEAYRKIPHPRLVYTGVFQEKIDLPLLIDIAWRRPLWQQVFVGPVEPKNLDKELIEKLKQFDNVHFLGERDVDEIPGFMDGADVLMLPYISTPNMQSAGLSLKFFEYLISGKPIVVAPYTRMQVSDRLYYLADGPEAWCAALDRLIDGDADDRHDERIAAAMENTYKARLETQWQLLAPFFK
jgi:glycosyltransferase involved in cell wall biosynthesis